MGKYFFTGSIIILLCCRPNENVEQVRLTKIKGTQGSAHGVSGDFKKRTIDVRGDTTYLSGDFLIEGCRNMKFEFVKKGDQAKMKTKGDTLYSGNKLLILGDWRQSWGVYKKFKFRHNFKDFPVDSIYTGKLAKPDFKTDPMARHYRTVIRTACSMQGINFAGHYTMAEWGCGTGCQNMAIVDRINGTILFSKIPFDALDGHAGLDYKANSNMILVNTESLVEHKGYILCNHWRAPVIYELKKGNFKRVE